jgi:4-amino-4-deoxy-L-arabinose transferase-like glycosyltransferase
VTGSSPPKSGPRHGAAAAATDVRETPRLSSGVALAIGLVAFAAIAAFYVFGASGFPLSEPDEARYAEIAREMLVRGDWITPHLNFVKYFEKPPLVYWSTAAAFAAFGQSEFVARLPSVLSGLATIALTVWLAARMYGAATALLALPILALSPLFGLMSQVITLDMSLTFLMTLAMVAVWFGWSAGRDAHGSAEVMPHGGSGTRPAASPMARVRSGGTASGASRTWYRIAYVATALAVLVKGPVAAVLVGGAALLFLVLHGGLRALRPAFDWRGALLALLLTLPWHALVSLRNPEFLHFYVVDQHINRYLWTKEHGAPIWFFLPVIPIALTPWGLLLLFDPPVLRAALRPRTWSPATRFLVTWAAVIVAFFSLSTSKLLTYVLPAIPAIAVLTARAIVLAVARGRTVGLSRVGWLLLIGGPVMSLCGAVLPLVNHHRRMPILTPRLLVGGPLLLATGWLIRRELAKSRPYAALGVLAVGWLAFSAAAITAREAANDYRGLGLAARAAMQSADRLAMYNHYTQGIPFYAQRRVVMVRNVGELRFGSQQGDHSAYFWPSDDDLRREWSAPGRLFLVINRAELAKITPPLEPPPTIVASEDKKVLVVNR